jgi:KaiC/GvpD/RAD55 family RecA-like ATPase
MNGPADSTAGPEAGASESAAGDVARTFGLRPEVARRLAEAGYSSVDQVRALTPEILGGLGLENADIERIVHPSPSTPSSSPSATSPPAAAPSSPFPPTPAVEPSDVSERLLQSVRSKEVTKRRRPIAPTKDSAEVVRKWVDGDDRALDSWMRPGPGPEAPRTPAAPGRPTPSPAPAATSAPAAPALIAPAVAPPVAPAEPAVIPVDIVERERTVLHWLTELLDRMKSDKFDPGTVLQDLEDLQRELYDARAARARLEAEVEQVKRGSIAVIKYIRSREAKQREQALQEKEAELAEMRLRLIEAPMAGTPAGGAAAAAAGWAEAEARLREEFGERESAYAEREAEMRRQIVQLGAELRELRVKAQLAEDRKALVGLPQDAIGAAVEKRLGEVEAREKQLVTRENELRAKFEEIRLRAQDSEHQAENAQARDKEIGQRERQLEATKAALEVEARRLEQMRQEEGEARRSVEASQLEQLRSEIAHREEELRLREDRLREKAAELERRSAQGAAEERPDAPAEAATESGKLPTGVRRLDDLLFGGLPKGSQILVSGPAHTGKETLSRLFVAEGLRRGIPAIWVLTDKTYAQIREEMTAVLPSYPQLEAKGMLRYVDLYSRSLGVSQSEAGVRLFQVTDKGILEQVTSAVNTYGNELKSTYPTYRLVFESVSTVTAYLDLAATFRFFQPFTGRRKLDGAVAYYLLETGMHSESDMESLEHMVDGSLNLKVEQLKTFLSVRGVTESQSRAWIGYTFTKKTFSLGSFSLDHIR